MIRKGINITIKESDDKERTITAIGSKETVDRDGDILMIKGVNTKNYKKNSVVLLNHNYHDFPIGKAVGKKVWVDGDELKFKIQFASEEENPKAEQAYKLFKGGYLNAFSLGFIPNYEKTEYPEKHKKGARRIFHEAELLEISAVSVPANQDALRAGINKAWDDGILDGEELNEWKDVINNQPEEEKEFETEIVKNITVKEELTEELTKLKKIITKKETEIEELRLMLKEQELDEEIDDFDSYLSEIFDEYDSNYEPKENPEDEEWIDGALEELTENE